MYVVIANGLRSLATRVANTFALLMHLILIVLGLQDERHMA